MMKAGIYLEKGKIEVRKFPLPEVGTDVLVQNLYSGICGIDIAVFQHGPEEHNEIIHCTL